MASKFKDFFPDDNNTYQEQEKKISNRLPAFKAKPIDEAQALAIRKSVTKTNMIKGIPIKEIDTEANMLALVTACITYPDLQDAALQEAWGVMGAEALVRKMLLPGEYARLTEWVSELCGFNQTLQDLVDEAKN